MNNIEKLENGRAEFAFHCVQEVVELKGNDVGTQYRQLSRSLPYMIKTNGYGASMAFLYSKGSTAHKDLLTHILNWLIERKMIEKGKDKDGFMKVITQSSSAQYKELARETMSFLAWLKRFAEGSLDSGKV